MADRNTILTKLRISATVTRLEGDNTRANLFDEAANMLETPTQIQADTTARIEALEAMLWECVEALELLNKWGLVITNHADRIDGDAARPISDVVLKARTTLTRAQEMLK